MVVLTFLVRCAVMDACEAADVVSVFVPPVIDSGWLGWRGPRRMFAARGLVASGL